MEVQKIAADKLHISENNTRKHNSLQIKEFKRSYEKFGQYRPLVVAEDGEIIIGNGFYEALRDTLSEFDCYVLPKGTSPNYKKKLMLADNQIFMLGANDAEAVDKIMNSLSADDFDIPGFDEETLKQLYAEVEITAKEAFTVDPEKILAIQTEEEARENGKVTPLPENKQDSYVAQPVTKSEPSVDSNVGRRYVSCPHCGAKVYL